MEVEDGKSGYSDDTNYGAGSRIDGCDGTVMTFG